MAIQSKGLFRLLVIALLVATVVIVSAATRMRLSRNSKAAAQANNAQLPERNRQIAQMESELITVTPHGFEPQEITRPAGAFLLFIEDRSGFKHVSPQLSRLAGLHVLNLKISREQPDWSDVLNLQPGTYLLTDSDHPTWLCRVTINP